MLRSCRHGGRRIREERIVNISDNRVREWRGCIRRRGVTPRSQFDGSTGLVGATDRLDDEFHTTLLSTPEVGGRRCQHRDRLCYVYIDNGHMVREDISTAAAR